MKLGIIQSNYIPWRGYFDFIDDVDMFIYYDDAQYRRHDWRNRNKIKTANGLSWLTVPVIFSLNNTTTIENAKIDYTKRWQDKHIESIRQSYSKAPFYEQFSEGFFNILRCGFQTISQLNVSINNWIMQQLEITTQIRMSSEFKAVGSKTDRLIDLLQKAGATSYVSGPAAKDYLEVAKFKAAGIGLEYKVYEYNQYHQLHGRFESNVSVLDLLFNCGKDSRKYLKSLKASEEVI